MQEKIEETRRDVGRLASEVKQYLDEQNDRYLALLAKRAQAEQEARARHERERAEKQRREQEQRERQKLEAEAERQRLAAEKLRLESEEAESRREREDADRRRKDAEQAEQRRRAEEKMRQLEAILAAEAEKNYRLQREEILFMLEADTAELARMEDTVLILVDRQKKISGLRRRRRALYTIPEEEERDEEEELRLLVERTDRLLAALRANGQDLGRLRLALEATAAGDPSCHLLEALQGLEKILHQQADNLLGIQADTELCHDKHAQRLEDGLRRQREAEAENEQLLRDEASLGRLKADTDEVRWRQNRMQLELETAPAKTSAELAEKNREMYALKSQISELAVLEADIFQTSKELEDWKAFAWPEEVQTEMNRYGMIGSLAVPAFPDGLLSNPALQAAILARREALQMLREKLAREAIRMAEVCAALAAMEERRREAELRRLAEQALVWTFDQVPMGPAEFGSVPTFRYSTEGLRKV
jgi:hypothetical protein